MTACRGIVIVSFGILVSGLNVWASPNIVAGELAFVFDDERTPDTYSQAGRAVMEVTAHDDARGRERGPVSALFGLDKGVPQLFSPAACDGAGGMDGWLCELRVTRLVEMTRKVKPWDLADRCDGDSNRALHLDASGPAVFDPSAAGQLTDPRNDLNEVTIVSVTRKVA